MSDKVKINLQFANPNSPLTIKRHDVEQVDEAAKQVNVRLNAFRTHYPNLDLEKVIAMVAYEFSLDNLKQKERNDTEPYTGKIKELTGILEDYFRKE